MKSRKIWICGIDLWNRFATVGLRYADFATVGFWCSARKLTWCSMITVERALEKSMGSLHILLRLQDLVSSYFALCTKFVARKINNCGANQLFGGLMFIGSG